MDVYFTNKSWKNKKNVEKVEKCEKYVFFHIFLEN
jgi:hypothetical protein